MGQLLSDPSLLTDKNFLKDTGDMMHDYIAHIKTLGLATITSTIHKNMKAFF